MRSENFRFDIMCDTLLLSVFFIQKNEFYGGNNLSRDEMVEL